MKVAVGISGGVDSAVTARMLIDSGAEVIGLTMTLGRADESAKLAEAREASARLGIPLEVIDLSAEWKRGVLDYIRKTYLAGDTPNPCVTCNERVKFGLLARHAFDTLGCDRFATGHYARVDEEGRLFRGLDHGKDQSYFLYRVDQEILSRTLFPLGAMSKTEVRAKAAEYGLVIADKPDSQDFCGGDVEAIVGEVDRPGDVVDVNGRVLGRHRGFWHHTVGQRKGLGIGGGTPYYVVRLDAERNQVVVAFKEATVVREFSIAETKWLADVPTDEVGVKVRSAGEVRGPATIAGNRVCVTDGISGVASGQSAVFYRGEQVLGGGYIVV